MTEFIVIVESGADARTATKLAERILAEKVDWLEDSNLQYFFQWSGLQNGTQHSCWKYLDKIIEEAKSLGYKPARFMGHYRDGVPYKEYGAKSDKVLKLVHFLQKTRRIRAILLIIDLDNKSERRQGLEQARAKHINRQPQLEIVIGTADRMREAWVLNGFIPSNQEEEQILEELKDELKFDPCIESHRLRGRNDIRDPKEVVNKLTGGNMEREQQCWEDTSLELLRERGIHSGLTDYFHEVEQRLTPIL
ncbi:MAG: hypothetical protein F6J96_35735 [Symploca sp. SIO1C2]|nr:hypothetical protein [Symploca sp. SIO1C2]